MYTQTRAQLTSNDHLFIAQTLAATPEEQSAILRLTEDVETMTDLLHRKQLFERSMTTPPLFLSVSPQLFFYVFIYQALEHKKIVDDDVVDYIAGMCVEFRSHEMLWQLASTRDGKTVYMVDLLNLLGEVDKHRQYILHRYIGNISLFLTGFFPDFIFQRSMKQGAPPLSYYENVGRAQYETAAGQSRSHNDQTEPVLNLLAERFVDVRSAINLYSDAYLHLNNKKHSLEIIERQAATLDEESFRQSLDL